MTEQTPPADREEPAFIADERTTLDGWLDYHRRTLLWKCEGLSDDQLKTAAVPPSTLTLLGLVRHMAEVERGWFGGFFDDDDSFIFGSKDDPDADFERVAAADVASDLATFQQEIDRYREKAPACSIDEVRHRHGRDIGLRWIYTHMIEEYARHNGHADLLREALDGATGD
jgi:uncharacterized damage-inducible protein DinB